MTLGAEITKNAENIAKVSKDSNLTINGFSKEFEADILQDMKEFEKELQNKTAELYDSHADFLKDLDNGKI
ncbi:hypothetical protein DCO58_11925 [Helicobacter saguini]|uniref:Uncharacterized protein n=1 Tax=Helicobacter saguini TaxID=1548018 RepID=A0A347VYZ8_9HELI|nr:hypothetical protein [Helicobacter saguini]MWV61003.1 hypothetical protein [Helicobacter saguini]MWV68328.1 hypothetical protein [Helicobacter saguini]MWV70207.1 hypothetical protein [Helicobacter saguini]MWV72110.1 hypothetical protein [Helicobacter saguini]TLD91469.1 hypothetical protein LS64_011960 [Helicobacter saguini]